jgi:hypothetical protein
MKTFRFNGVRTIDEFFTVEVQAESLEEAEKLIDEGDFDEFGHRQDYVDGSEEIEFDEEVVDEESDEDDDFDYGEGEE